ncbi:TPA: hypothetical protein L1194_004713 [Escherichia coli]|nr:hypothetical protein [Escherichia coli]
MSPWPGCGGAAQSRRGEVAFTLWEMEQKTSLIPGINQYQQYKWRYRLRDVLVVLNKYSLFGVFLIFCEFKLLSLKKIFLLLRAEQGRLSSLIHEKTLDITRRIG